MRTLVYGYVQYVDLKRGKDEQNSYISYICNNAHGIRSHMDNT